MSKKEKVPVTFEELARKVARKDEKSKLFEKTFTRAFIVFISLALIYSVVYIAFTPATSSVVASGTQYGGGTNATPGGSSQPSGDNNTNPGSNAADGSGSSSDKPVTELSASSPVADVVNYFNTSINKVKPNAKKITLTKEVNSTAGSVSGLPKTLNSLADKLIASNMGEKDLAKLASENAEAVNATTADGKNAMFPVENENWSSKLTADDIENFKVVDKGSTYEISLLIKADAPSADTAHGTGHNGKVFSVIMPSIVTENAGAASSIIKEVTTGHSDGKITAVIDKASGNMTGINYYFVWTLSVTALGANVTMPFGLEKSFTIAW